MFVKIFNYHSIYRNFLIYQIFFLNRIQKKVRTKIIENMTGDSSQIYKYVFRKNKIYPIYI